MLDDDAEQTPREAGEEAHVHVGLDRTRREVRADSQVEALRAVQTALLTEIDDAVTRLESARLGETTREHLEILRGLLKAQVTAYIDHFVTRRAPLYSHTSVMYAGEVGSPGVLFTTFRGLLDAGTITGGQAARLIRLISERRTLVIFGNRGTGKSTLLNSLFELVPMDERFVAVERGPDLPALKERSFCVRLGVNDDTDVSALFAKARRMSPGRLVVGEMHAGEMREFFRLLAEDTRIGGMATVRADSVGRAEDIILGAFGEAGDEGRVALAAVRPVFAHMYSDEKGLPSLAALWAVTGTSDGELVLEEVDTGVPAGSRLAAET